MHSWASNNCAKVPTPPNDAKGPSKKVALQRSANRFNETIFRILSSNSTFTDPNNPNMTMQSEDYSIIEAQIEEANSEIKNEKKLNIAALAHKYALSEQRLCARLKGRISKQQREAPNRKLTRDQELGLCEYLDGLDELGIPP